MVKKKKKKKINKVALSVSAFLFLICQGRTFCFAPTTRCTPLIASKRTCSSAWKTSDPTCYSNLPCKSSRSLVSMSCELRSNWVTSCSVAWDERTVSRVCGSSSSLKKPVRNQTSNLIHFLIAVLWMSIAVYVDGRIEAFLHGMEVTNNRFLCRSLVLITICEELDCIDPALFSFLFFFSLSF